MTTRSGSSPLARGLPGQGGQVVEFLGIIPARAGFTPRPGGPSSWSADHPRSRGVYAQSICAPATMTGSSPLARGLPAALIPFQTAWRIIPARAGFTSSSKTASLLDRDHPRSRGVYLRSSGDLGGVPGSSPLARGLRFRDIVADGRNGIIPARAGFTSMTSLTAARTLDHPRSRGVYPSFLLVGRVAPGSSPLARGLRDAAGAGRGRRGIIPARAGFTTPATDPGHPRKDHPRSRGVYAEALVAATAARGSSPLARGLRGEVQEFEREGGIIPARAGFTRSCTAVRSSGPDHPRSRGVYANVSDPYGGSYGSSPLARGLLEAANAALLAERIIPARAGFTNPILTY